MKRYFNQVATDFNPRSLAGATAAQAKGGAKEPFSIHAPSRERPTLAPPPYAATKLFNPRSLAGATISAT